MAAYVICLFLISLPGIVGENILLNKPSRQSSSYVNQPSNYGSPFGNDGDPSTTSMTSMVESPFWQGDLQAFYMVSTISLLSPSNGFENHLKNVSIGVSALDIDCPGSDVITCGQWPDEKMSGTTLVFRCSLTRPVRFVRIWKEKLGHVTSAELEATGRKLRMEFTSIQNNKLSTQTTSFTVTNIAKCARACFETESCIAFSFRQGGQLNCLLGTAVTMTADTEWNTSKIKDC